MDGRRDRDRQLDRDRKLVISVQRPANRYGYLKAIRDRKTERNKTVGQRLSQLSLQKQTETTPTGTQMTKTAKANHSSTGQVQRYRRGDSGQSPQCFLMALTPPQGTATGSQWDRPSIDSSSSS